MAADRGCPMSGHIISMLRGEGVAADFSVCRVDRLESLFPRMALRGEGVAADFTVCRVDRLESLFPRIAEAL